MTQALYRKWRPHTWEQVFGQEHIIQTLRNAVASDRVAHAMLFAGPRGTGKTTTARILAKAVNCLAPDLAARPCDGCEHCVAVNQGRFLDLIEIDAASNTSVEDVRDLRDKINFSPNQGRYKVYIVDEVHMLSTAAFNALLKTLEEPPSHAIFILATTEIHKIPATVLSRCQRHEFRRIPVVDIVRQLQILCEGENIQVEPEALTLFARQAAGGMRDAISLLDQLASTGQRITLSLAQTILGAATGQAVLDLIDALLASDSAAGLNHIHAALDAGTDPRQFARQIVEYLRQLLLVQMGNAAQVDATAEARAVMARHAAALPAPSLLRVIKAFNQAAADARMSWQPALPLEMAFVESLGIKDEVPPVEATQGNEVPTPRAARQPAKSSHSHPVKAAAAEASDSVENAPVSTNMLDQSVTSPAPAPPTDDPLYKRLAASWKEIVASVKQRNANTAGLLNSIKTRDLRGDILTLGFASDMLKNQMEKPANIEIFQGVLQQALGVEIVIRCVTASGQRSAPPPDVDHDGMVASALRDLGGEIVDVS
jgi:DNA polymerase-3 subunit gamma/tau